MKKYIPITKDLHDKLIQKNLPEMITIRIGSLKPYKLIEKKVKREK